MKVTITKGLKNTILSTISLSTLNHVFEVLQILCWQEGSHLDHLILGNDCLAIKIENFDQLIKSFPW